MQYYPHRFVLLEALSATGLRAIRYAKEIPLVKYVIANDLSPTAVDAIRRNVEINGLGEKSLKGTNTDVDEVDDIAVDTTVTGDTGSLAHKVIKGKENVIRAKVRINEGDAWWVKLHHCCSDGVLTMHTFSMLMYSHRPENLRVDVVDLDPYGTAAPFIDSAVQCVSDGGESSSNYFLKQRLKADFEGLLCVTCTDMSVLATNNYPEKWYVNPGKLNTFLTTFFNQFFKLWRHSSQGRVLPRIGKYKYFSRGSLVNPLKYLRHYDLFYTVCHHPHRVMEDTSSPFFRYPSIFMFVSLSE